MTDQPIIPDTPRAALEVFIAHNLEAYRSWYEAAAKRNYTLWSMAQFIGVLSGFVTALIAAVIQSDQFIDWRFGRVLLVLLPIVGALASTFVIQSRIRELAVLRESGRIAVEHLKEESRRRFAAAVTPADYSEIHAWLHSEVTLLEQQQAKSFFSIVPEQITFGASTNGGRSVRRRRR